METALSLIPLLPLLGFLVNGLLGKHLGKKLTHLVACAGPVAAFILAVRLFATLRHDSTPIEATLWTWISVGALKLDFALMADRLTAIMLLVVTGVGSLIHIYAGEYMETEDEGGYARFFAYLNLFTAMMLVLVTGASLPMMFIGWEGVGLCSYLLIGFWYQDTKNADAGRKAFVVNRVGDFGFLLGMFMLYVVFRDLSFDGLHRAALGATGSTAITAARLLLLVGAAGKSAQIPLYVWLPDAMAGPTPVSALIHAATMVTAGVYMVARLGALFALAPVALTTIAAIGVLTALVAAFMALTENDLKKVLAYSTISQLGYMFLGVGTGVYAAGVFHLVTHAFFKALLFLGAGAVMHAVHHMDMRRMGGLRTKMPGTFMLFMVGAFSLAGIPPFSGFFSKDEILTLAFGKFAHGGEFVWLPLWGIGVITAGMTAFYTFRAVALTFFGESRASVDEHAHAHDPGPRMLWVLGGLAALAALGGFLNVPPIFEGHSELFQFLAPVTGEVAHHEIGFADWLAVLLATGLGLVCAYAAFWMYTQAPQMPQALLQKPALAKLHALSYGKLFVDELYDKVFVKPIQASAVALWRYVDVAIIDAAVNRTGEVTRALAHSLRGVQGGLLNQYSFYLAGGAVAVLILVLGTTP